MGAVSIQQKCSSAIEVYANSGYSNFLEDGKLVKTALQVEARVAQRNYGLKSAWNLIKRGVGRNPDLGRASVMQSEKQTVFDSAMQEYYKKRQQEENDCFGREILWTDIFLFFLFFFFFCQ